MPFTKQLNISPSAVHQLPVATQALSAFCTSEDGSGKEVFYISGSFFYKWDTISKSAVRLANPNIAPATILSMRYTKNRGHHARVLGATANTVTIAGLRGKVLDGFTMEIDKGTGMGQERVLTLQSETVHDFGMITATATNYLQDNTKKWRVNQWRGYLVGITFGTDATQYKKILYNDANTLYISDANLMPQEHWNNQAFVASAPYALPVVTAGAQAHFEIMSQTFSTDTAWDITPDLTSYAKIKSGGIYLLSSSASAPFLTLQYWDRAHDSWTNKTVPQSFILSAFGTDSSIERLAEVGVPYISSVSTSITNRTLTDTTLSMPFDRYRNYRIKIMSGTGFGQTQRIVANTSNTFYLARNWDITPDATSTYKIVNDYRKLLIGGNASSALYSYNPEHDFMAQGEFSDFGVVANIAVKQNGWEAFGVTSGARIASGVRTINPVPTAGGANYVIGDVLTCSVGGTGAQFIVTSIGVGGVVTGLELVHSGTATGFTVGTGRATTGGTGTGCTAEITAVGATALITLPTAHFFKTGDVVSFSGCTEGAWNTSHTILGVPATTTFCVSVTATANMVATASQSTTTIVDPTQNWVVNEHAGKLVNLMVAGLTPTSQPRWIISNTATVLTVATITAGVNGTSKYVIYDSKLFGVDTQFKPEVRRGYGHASGGSTTTLQDTSKVWVPNQWAGYRFRIDAGAGLGSGLITVISNTENTLTYATQTFTPDATTMYEIQDGWGLLTASTTTTYTETGTKNWLLNQWAGKRLKISGGLGVGQELTITSNTNNALTTATATAGDATTTYAILGIPVRGIGIELIHINNNSNSATRGKYILFPRGSASNTADLYDVTTGRWIYGYFFSPQGETFSTGSSYAYDGEDYIFASINVVSDYPRIICYDVNKNTVVGGMMLDNMDGTLTIGNKMEIYETDKGKVLMIGLNTSRLVEEKLLTHLY